MPKKILASELHELTMLMEVDVATWGRVLQASDETARLEGASLTHEALFKSLNTTPPGEKLLDALGVIVELGTEEGRELLLNVADDAQLAIEGAADLPAREFAARTWLQSLAESALGEVLVRARVNSHEIARVRTGREFAAKAAKSTAPLTQSRVLAAITEQLAAGHQREALDAFVFEREGEWRCEVLRGDAAKRVVAIRQGRPDLLSYQSAASDHLRYELDTGRLTISTRSTRLLQVYRRVMGSLLDNDPEFFSDENICSLKPLQDHGNALFERHRMHEICRVDVVELRWRKGDRDQLSVRGRDCFRLLDDVGARLQEGTLIEAKLSVAVSGRARPAIATIKVPNRIEIKAGAHKPFIEELLDRVGIRGYFGDADRRTFWSLPPWRLPTREWMAHVGPDFYQLVDRRILRLIQLDAVTHPRHLAAGAALAVEHVNDAYVGFGEDPAIGVRTLTSSDIEGYEPDFSMITKEIVYSLHLDGPVSEPTSGLWSLGQLTVPSTDAIKVFLATRSPSETSEALLREANRKNRAVLLVPPGCSCTLELVQLECRLPKGPYRELYNRILEEFGLERSVPPALRFHEDLIIDEEGSAAWFRGVSLSKLAPGSHAFKFALAVTRANGLVVTTDDLTKLLSPARTDGAVAKLAKSGFLKAVEASYKDAERPYPAEAAKKLFIGCGGGYKLAGTGRVF